MKKVSVIIGYGGIGSAIAKELASTHLVIALHHSPLSNIEQQMVAKLGVQSLQCDITSPSSVRDVVNQLYKKHNQIDNYIFAATSKLVRKKVSALTLEEFISEFSVNVFGFFNFCVEITPKLVAQKHGTITVITTSAIEPNSHSTSMGGYIPAKYALRGLLRQLAQELGPQGVRVNAIAPGFVRTPLQADVPTRADDFVKEKNLMHQMVQPEDVAKVAAFLVSDEARALTGVSVPVTFGETISL